MAPPTAPPSPAGLKAPADALLSADNQDEAWCSTHFLLHAALRLAVAIRLELLEVMQRIELPVSPPAFGCQDNVTNIKRALISGFFLNVSTSWLIHRLLMSASAPAGLGGLLMSASPQVANDVDGSGNYLLLTHRHVAHLHPLSSYLCRRPRPSPPSWVLYHKFTISHDNSVCVASEVHPQM